MGNKNNIDHKVVDDFGKEWKAFNHQDLENNTLKSAFDSELLFNPLDNEMYYNIQRMKSFELE